MENASFIMNLQPVTMDTANERQKKLLAETKQKNGMIPNMHTNMAHSPGSLEMYNRGYTLFREESGFTPVEQEVIFLTISYENGCDYCIAAHSVVADMMSKVPVEVTNAIREGKEIPHARLKALAEFTRVMVNKRGRPSQKDAENFLNAGYAEKQILEIILAISVKTISNYFNHVFNTPIDLAFKAREWSAYKMGRTVVNFFR